MISFKSFIFGLSRVSRKGAKVRNVARPLICILIATPLLAPPGHTRKRQTFHLANQVLGESLDHFKKHFPQVACGSLIGPVSGPWTFSRHNLTDPDGSELIYCCIDLISQVSLLSPSWAYQLDRSAPCPGYAIFEWEKLSCLGFMIEGVSLEDLLPEFEHEYGPADWHVSPEPQDVRWERIWNPTGLPRDWLQLTGPVKIVDRGTGPLVVEMLRFDWYVPKKVDQTVSPRVAR